MILDITDSFDIAQSLYYISLHFYSFTYSLIVSREAPRLVVGRGRALGGRRALRGRLWRRRAVVLHRAYWVRV